MRVDEFVALLESASRELYEDNPERMVNPGLIPTPNVIDAEDVRWFGRAIDAGLITLLRGGRFNTLDRPAPQGRWGLLSRSREGGWYNAEYLPQIAAYARAVLEFSFPAERVLFELPSSALQLDLAVLDDERRVVVLGEAKRDVGMLGLLLADVLARFSEEAPDEDSKRRGDEARQLAWRLWTVQPDRLWLIGPGVIRSFRCSFSPLELEPESALADAAALGLATPPAAMLAPPQLMGPNLDVELRVEPGTRPSSRSMTMLADALGYPPDDVMAAMGDSWDELDGVEPGAVCFVSGEPSQVLIVVNPDERSVAIAEPAVDWEGAMMPVMKVGAIHLRWEFPSEPELDDIVEAVRLAAKARRRRFRWCEYCRQIQAPEYMNEPGVCQGCAQEFLGVVY